MSFQTIIQPFASPICVPEARQVIFPLDSKWPPGGDIYVFFELIVKACGRTFLRQHSMEFYQSYHIASTMRVPDARRVISDHIQNGHFAVKSMTS